MAEKRGTKAGGEKNKDAEKGKKFTTKEEKQQNKKGK